jgi:hypothetical protein
MSTGMFERENVLVGGYVSRSASELFSLAVLSEDTTRSKTIRRLVDEYVTHRQSADELVNYVAGARVEHWWKVIQFGRNRLTFAHYLKDTAVWLHNRAIGPAYAGKIINRMKKIYAKKTVQV